jgi:hypothetical protein
MLTRSSIPVECTLLLTRLIIKNEFPEIQLVNSLNMKVVHINCHITIIRMIKLIHMISILNSVFTLCYT